MQKHQFAHRVGQILSNSAYFNSLFNNSHTVGKEQLSFLIEWKCKTKSKVKELEKMFSITFYHKPPLKYQVSVLSSNWVLTSDRWSSSDSSLLWINVPLRSDCFSLICSAWSVCALKSTAVCFMTCVVPADAAAAAMMLQLCQLCAVFHKHLMGCLTSFSLWVRPDFAVISLCVCRRSRGGTGANSGRIRASSTFNQVHCVDTDDRASALLWGLLDK